MSSHNPNVFISRANDAFPAKKETIHAQHFSSSDSLLPE